MTIESRVLEYLQIKGQAVTSQVEDAVPAGNRAVYSSLRKLAISGRVKKTLKRDSSTGYLLAHWEVKKAHGSPETVPQSWLSALGL